MIAILIVLAIAALVLGYQTRVVAALVVGFASLVVAAFVRGFDGYTIALAIVQVIAYLTGQELAFTKRRREDRDNTFAHAAKQAEIKARRRGGEVADLSRDDTVRLDGGVR